MAIRKTGSPPPEQQPGPARWPNRHHQRQLHCGHGRDRNGLAGSLHEPDEPRPKTASNWVWSQRHDHGKCGDDNIWGQDTNGDTGDAASGILIYASTGITVSGNQVASAQFGIVSVTDPNYGPADGTMVAGNKIAGTQIFDAIDMCSNSNTVQSN